MVWDFLPNGCMTPFLETARIMTRLSFLLLLPLVAGIALASNSSRGVAQEAADKSSDPVYLDEPTPAPKPSVAAETKVLEKYDDGKTRVERQVRKMSDDSIMNHGTFTEFYRNGQKFSEGAFKEGVPDGQWSYWHDNGQLSKTVNFTRGQPDGSWEVFRADGTLETRKAYKAGQREGKWVAFFADGKTPNIEQYYVDGKLDGPVNVYFKDGKPKIQTNFKANVREGVSTEWDESGRKLIEASYANNKLDGKVTRYGADGKNIEEFYREGKRVQSGATAPAPGK
jgi:antitoxin component YwqK of YwqJK toxin-antitoxin module